MLFGLLKLLLVWSGSVLAWLIFSAFVHELCHLVSSWLVGFKIQGFRLFSVPRGAKGYVDVVIARGTKNYYLKRGLMHLSGVVSHLLLAGLSLMMLGLSQGVGIKGVWLSGVLVNGYLFLINSLPWGSDGRQFWDMLVRAKLKGKR